MLQSDWILHACRWVCFCSENAEPIDMANAANMGSLTAFHVTGIGVADWVESWYQRWHCSIATCSFCAQAIEMRLILSGPASEHLGVLLVFGTLTYRSLTPQNVWHRFSRSLRSGQYCQPWTEYSPVLPSHSCSLQAFHYVIVAINTPSITLYIIRYRYPIHNRVYA